MRFRKVDLPEPEGPSMTQTSPRFTVQVMPSSTWTRASPGAVVLLESVYHQVRGVALHGDAPIVARRLTEAVCLEGKVSLGEVSSS